MYEEGGEHTVVVVGDVSHLAEADVQEAVAVERAGE